MTLIRRQFEIRNGMPEVTYFPKQQLRRRYLPVVIVVIDLTHLMRVLEIGVDQHDRQTHVVTQAMFYNVIGALLVGGFQRAFLAIDMASRTDKNQVPGARVSLKMI